MDSVLILISVSILGLTSISILGSIFSFLISTLVGTSILVIISMLLLNSSMDSVLILISVSTLRFFSILGLTSISIFDFMEGTSMVLAGILILAIISMFLSNSSTGSVLILTSVSTLSFVSILGLTSISIFDVLLGTSMVLAGTLILVIISMFLLNSSTGSILTLNSASNLGLTSDCLWAILSLLVGPNRLFSLTPTI